MNIHKQHDLEKMREEQRQIPRMGEARQGDSIYLKGEDEEYAIVEVHTPLKGIVIGFRIVPIHPYTGASVGHVRYCTSKQIEKIQLN